MGRMSVLLPLRRFSTRAVAYSKLGEGQPIADLVAFGRPVNLSALILLRELSSLFIFPRLDDFGGQLYLKIGAFLFQAVGW